MKFLRKVNTYILTISILSLGLIYLLSFLPIPSKYELISIIISILISVGIVLKFFEIE